MILGIEFEWGNIILGGISVFLLLVFQMLVGLRVIKFKGRTHSKVHKWGAWLTVAVAGVHGFLAATIFYGWRILS